MLVGAAISHHHDWGWNAWDVNWGAPRAGYGGGWERPAVVYNNATYVSKSVTVVNHVNNVNVVNNNYRTTNNVVNRTRDFAIQNAARPPAAIAGAAHFQPNYAPMAAAPTTHPAQRPVGPMTVPHFTAHDAVPGARPAFAAPAMHAAVAPHVNAFTAPPRAAPVAPMAREGGGAGMHTPPAPHAEPSMPPVGHVETAMPVAQHAQAAMPPVRPAEAAARPVRRAEAFMPHATPANHDVNGLDRPRDHAARQEMVAMHNERPHAAPPAPVRHAAVKHEETGHHHDKHDGQERHG